MPTENDLERKHMKTLADILTGLRVILGVGIAWLGLVHRLAAFPVAGIMVLASWLTDLLDGPLARRSGVARQTWIGSHDAEADLSTSLGLSIFLAGAGVLNPWVCLGLMVAIVFIWVRFSYPLAWPLYAIPYALYIRAALRLFPVVGWSIVFYLAILLMARWKRLKGEYLPKLGASIADLIGRDTPSS